MPDSFIHQLQRRLPGFARWPNEKLVTAATAAVLDQVDEFAATLVETLAGPGIGHHGDIAIATEVPTRRGRRYKVDLELAVAEDLLIWIEAKVDAREGPDQLEGYAGDLEEQRNTRRFAESRLFFLTKTGEHRPNADPVTWQKIAECARGCLAEQDEQSASGWLLNQYLIYLKEMALADIQPVSTDLADTVTAYHEARGALEALLTSTLERLEVATGPNRRSWVPHENLVSGGGSARNWPQWWAAFPIPNTSYPASCDLDFCLGADDDSSDIIGAGLIWRRELGGLNPIEANPAWIEEIRAIQPPGFGGGFVDPALYGYERLYRRIRFADLGHDSLSQQAESLEGFARWTYEALLAHPPPPGA